MAHVINGLKDIADTYDNFLIDVWGVLHDGQIFPGALEVLEQLKAKEKKVILFSNAPRRSYVAQEKLEAMGLPRHLYHHILTSGDRTYRFLQTLQAKGQVQEIFHIGTPKDTSLFQDMTVPVGKNLHKADWIVCSDAEDVSRGVETLDSLFHTLLGRHVPMICANPDRCVSYKGNLIPCAGALAQRYKDLGGTVHFFGKPERGMYQDAIPETGATLAVGDSLYTDVQGALNFGIDVLFIQGGIHRGELGSPWGQCASEAALERLFSHHQMAAWGLNEAKIYTSPCLRWSP